MEHLWRQTTEESNTFYFLLKQWLLFGLYLVFKQLLALSEKKPKTCKGYNF